MNQNYLVLQALLFMLPSILLGQWEADLFYVKDADVNTYLYLKPPLEASPQSAFSVDLRFKLAGEPHDKFQKRFTLSVTESGYAIAPLFLPPGNYEVAIDLMASDFQQVAIAYDCGGRGADLAASSILLSHVPIQAPSRFQPIIHKITADTRELYFRIALYTQVPGPITARAVLYRAQKGGEATSTVYTSLKQINRVLDVNSSKTVFADHIQIDTLGEGDYLLETLFYRDEELLLEKSKRFAIEWKGKETLWQAPDRALEIMKYLFPASVIDSVLQLGDTKRKKEGMMSLWQQLYGQEAEAQMEAYFKRAFEANRLFGMKSAGWKSDQGRIFILYGPPANKTSKKLPDHRLVEYWQYPQLGLSFIFEQIDNNFHLVE